MTNPLFTFETTHHALWAEELANGAGIPAEVVPAPPEARARCNLALETLPKEADRLAGELDGAGVPFRLYTPREPPGSPEHP
ncbi:MAG TPA: DUF3343 domain-containing protein [Longimicrobiaceae bacterium]|nr:DUF3343 domain-containing protein [Longimicrobiaceae bacterium]